MDHSRYVLPAACVALVVLLHLILSPALAAGGHDVSTPCPCSTPVDRGCTVFTISVGDRVFFGGNDDYVNRDGYYWVDPGGASGYGAIYFGQPDNVQQGFNEKGWPMTLMGYPGRR